MHKQHTGQHTCICAVPTYRDDLCADIRGGAAHGLRLPPVEGLGQAKVGNFHAANIILSRQEQVFELEVAVDNAHRVEVLEPLEQLHKRLPRVCFPIALVLEHGFEELPTRQVLADQVDLWRTLWQHDYQSPEDYLVAGDEALLHVHDVGVINLHQNLNFLENVLPACTCDMCYTLHTSATYLVNSSGDSCAPSLGRVMTLQAKSSPVVRWVTSRTVAKPVWLCCYCCGT